MRRKNDSEESALNELEQKLYQRETPLSVNAKKRTVLRGKSMDMKRGWQAENSSAPEPSMTPRKKKSKSRWPLLFAVAAALFFLISLGVALFTFTGGGNIISTNNVAIGVTGPVTVAGGEVLALEIDIQNGNTTTLETADLLIEYPEGTRAADNIIEELPRVRESLGNIRAGEEVVRTVEAVLFGQEGEKQTIVVSIEYRVAGSNAIFVKERSYEVEISSSPLSLSVSVPDQVTTHAEFELIAELTSNAEEDLEGIIFTAEYPFGFTFSDATPTPTFNERVWDVGTLKSGERAVIRIRGILSGQDNEERVFRFASGLREASDPYVLKTPFVNTLKGVTIARPDVGVTLAFEGNVTESYVAPSGEFVRTDVTWQNNTGERIVDAVVEVVIQGAALDKNSVSTGNGFYQSGTNTIVWDKRTVSKLADIPAGGTGQVSFSFAPFDFTRETLQDPRITVLGRVRGTVAGSSGAEVVQSESASEVVVRTDALLSGRALHFSGPFQNAGPVPPEVGNETFYTVVWTVTNTVSDVENATVRATLPAHMRFVGTISPANEDVIYNAVGGEIRWDVGRVKAGTGYTLPPREVAFQVALTPSVSQVNTEPILVGGATLSGTDALTGAAVRDTHGSMTTRITADPQFQNNHGRVVE